MISSENDVQEKLKVVRKLDLSSFEEGYDIDLHEFMEVLDIDEECIHSDAEIDEKSTDSSNDVNLDKLDQTRSEIEDVEDIIHNEANADEPTVVQVIGECTPHVPHEFVPACGMVFNSESDAYEFYNLYARMGGFDTKWYTSKKKKGEVCYRWIVCRNEGLKKQSSNAKRSYASKKCGCKAKMILNKRESTRDWVVKSVYYGHNHSLHSPSKINMHRSQKKLSTPQKSTLKMMFGGGFQPSQAMRLFAEEHGGVEHVPFTLDQIYAYQRKITRKYQGMDCQLTLNYLIRKKEENPDFYFAVQVDEKTEIGNCFWIDGKAREDYHFFGDVVSFDTTYKVNRYLMPFAPFTGINHHNQSIVFGCVLLVNEKTESFVWIFKEWLKAIGGRVPLSIITDQDLAMKAAIKLVFLETIHRFCMLHIGQKVPKNLKTLYRRSSPFKSLWDKWFYHSQSIEEFESNWEKMTTRFPPLLKAKFAIDLWKERQMWFSLYFATTFMAGLSTTQRSESMNNYFKKFVNKSTPLHQFITRFEKAMLHRRLAEKKADMNMVNEKPQMLTGTPMENFFFEIFTPAIFSKMRTQLVMSLSCFVQFDFENGDKRIYKGTQIMENEKLVDFQMMYDKSAALISGCTCMLWENSGIVCCHIFCILRAENIHTLLSRYILHRWTRKARTDPIVTLGPTQVKQNPTRSLTLQKHLFQLKSSKCLGEALICEHTFNDTLLWLNELFDKIQAKNQKILEKESTSLCEEGSTSIIRSADDIATNIFLNDREPIHAKGSGKRFKSTLELMQSSKTCSTCGKKGHYASKCVWMTSDVFEEAIPSKGPRKCKSCWGNGHDKRNCVTFHEKKSKESSSKVTEGSK